ncbi:MAG: hypothetical protein JO154_26260 [Chitinophaga sp.]|uniref:hypothetical protein n=1 Tax=Chitinophaga sp. TaxID=1869181 RepID=UPI0025BC000E|nr:hypothetical protein [Chitinophaga sp.]MBV8256126.1 hypothetical protein [Chitinophaga sp.]
MKKAVVKKLNLGKIKVADLGKKASANMAEGFSSIKWACPSQGAPICSVDSCRH